MNKRILELHGVFYISTPRNIEQFNLKYIIFSNLTFMFINMHSVPLLYDAAQRLSW